MRKRIYSVSVECVRGKNGCENEILNDDAIIIIARQNDLDESPARSKINIYFLSDSE
jgi:hypothetical protein